MQTLKRNHFTERRDSDVRQRKRSKELLNEMVDDSPDMHGSDNRSFTRSDSRDSDPAGAAGSLSDTRTSSPLSVGHRIKPRRARRAVRRAKSSNDEPKRRRIFSDIDPREPQVPRSEAIRSQSRTRQFSLPEGQSHGQTSDPDLMVTSQFNPNFTFASPQTKRSNSEPKEVQPSQNESVRTSKSACTMSDEEKIERGGRLKLRHSRSEDVSDVPPEVEFRPGASRTSSIKSVDRDKTKDNKPVRRTSSKGSRHRKNRGRSTLNEPRHDSSFESTKSEDVIPNNATTLDCSKSSRGSVRSSGSTVTPATSRSVTPSTFYTPESSCRSSITDMSELSSVTSDEVIMSHHSLKSNKSSRKVEPLTQLPEKSESSSTLTDKEQKQHPASSSSFSSDPGSDRKSKTLPEGDDKNDKNIKPKSASFFKLPAFLRKGSDESPPSLPQSQQSSVVGLDWLFSTDSDSASSGKDSF